MSYLGWVGKKARHPDGRTGVIEKEEGREFCCLHILCEGKQIACVTLNAYGKDSGAEGWQYWCPEFCHGPAWLPLGDNGSPLEYDPPRAEDSR